MNKKIFSISLLSALLLIAHQADADNAMLIRQGDLMEVDFDLDMANINPKSSEAIILTPMIVNNTDTLMLRSVGVYGKQRYYQCQRQGGMITGSDEVSMRKSDKPEHVQFNEVVRYLPWFDGASLCVSAVSYGCCDKSKLLSNETLASYAAPVEPVVIEPEMLFVMPQAETVKIRAREGKAYIDFVVNQTNILPDFRNNERELAKIRASIDSVRLDKDVSLMSIDIRGTASPEGPYDNNVRLAKGRTEALCYYVESLYGFQKGFIKTSYVPEDWVGLRQYVASSDLADRDALLQLIDSDMQPDAKDAAIRTQMPQTYKFLLENVYPSLRNSHYVIKYEVASYTDASVIAEVFARNPGNLSLNELYVLAQTYPQGSEQFCDVFETAVRLFPDDAVSNLNAANTAIMLGQLSKAERYLNKAGNLAEADYARGVLALKREQYDKAVNYLQKAYNQGIIQAAELIDYISSITK